MNSSKVNQLKVHITKFHFNGSDEVKERSDPIQRFFNSSELSKRSEHSQILPFNRSEGK